MKSSALLLFLFAILAGCSVAPINTATTARTLGTDKNQVTGSYPVLGVKYERGINDRFDLGFGIENQSGALFHVFGKYNFENKPDQGISVSGIAGAGYGSGIGDSKSAYLGPIISYKGELVEVFGSYKFNFVHWNFDGITPDNKDDLFAVPASESNFIYHEFDFGINIVEEVWSASVGGRIFIFPNTTSALPFLDIGYKF